jgi:hypothetical protein
MSSICFITPAHGRLPVSRIVFEQRRRACDRLIKHGHDATAVVVACDENLELARQQGFEIRHFPNTYLGRKWNAGYEIGARVVGADWLMPIGSDSLLDPALVLNWLKERRNPRHIPYTSHYAVVRKDGRARLDCVVTKTGGGGMMLPAAMLATVGYRPVSPLRQKGCDGSTLRALAPHGPKLKAWNVHPLAVVALQSEQQITSYDKLAARWGVGEETETPIQDLEPVYGPELVRDVKRMYAEA